MDWLFMFVYALISTLAIMRQELKRIESNLRYSYDLDAAAASFRSKIVVSAIYLPGFAIMVIGAWLNLEGEISQFGFCSLWLIGPLWVYSGYVMTGGKADEGIDMND